MIIKKMNVKIILLISIVIITPSINLITAKESLCIYTEEYYSYPYNIEPLQQLVTPTPNAGNWQKIFDYKDVNTYLVNMEILPEGDIWASYISGEFVKIAPDYSRETIYIVNTETGGDVIVDKMIITKGNDFWIMGRVPIDYNSTNLYIGRYNRETDSFQHIATIEYNNVTPFVSDIVEDTEGNLWFIVDHELMKLDKRDFSIEKIWIDISLMIPPGDTFHPLNYSLIIDDNDWLWFLGRYPIIGKKEMYDVVILLSYNIHSSEIQIYGSPPDMDKLPINDDHIASLFIDHNGKIWVSDYGWMEKTPDTFTWYKLLETSKFITKNKSSYRQYFYYHGHPEAETDNRYIWFSSTAGAFRYDTELDNWCQTSTFTTISIISDQDGNLIANTDEGLYKLIISDF